VVLVDRAVVLVDPVVVPADRAVAQQAAPVDAVRPHLAAPSVLSQAT
jgi:hypothetical protein